jgi:hypothetical protein
VKIFIKWLAFSGLVLILGYLLRQNLTINQVVCLINEQPLDAQNAVCRQLQQLRGSPLLFRDFEHDSQTAGFLYLHNSKEAFDLQKVTKSLTGQITFFLTDQPPLFRIEQGSTLYLVTASGFLRENNAELKVPLVSDPDQFYQDRLEQINFFLISFLQQLPDQRSQIEQIRLISPQRIELVTAHFPIIIVELAQEPQQLARRFKLILTKLKPNEIDLNLQEIDLRFNLPVLRTYQSSESAQVLIDS